MLTATQPLSQAFTLATDAGVSVGFAAVLRPGRQSGQVVQVEVDGTAVGQTNVGAAGAVSGFALGRLGAGVHTLTFRGTSGFDTFGDTTAFIDAVTLDAQVNVIPEPGRLGLMLTGQGLIVSRRRMRRLAPARGSVGGQVRSAPKK